MWPGIGEAQVRDGLVASDEDEEAVPGKGVGVLGLSWRVPPGGRSGPRSPDGSVPKAGGCRPFPGPPGSACTEEWEGTEGHRILPR